MMAAKTQAGIFEPDVETRDPAEQRVIDDVLYRKQIAYLFDRSPFYRDKLIDAGFDPAPLDSLPELPAEVSTQQQLDKSMAELREAGEHELADELASIDLSGMEDLDEPETAPDTDSPFLTGAPLTREDVAEAIQHVCAAGKAVSSG